LPDRVLVRKEGVPRVQRGVPALECRPYQLWVWEGSNVFSWHRCGCGSILAGLRDECDGLGCGHVQDSGSPAR
jgi:hypothetical protein